MSALPPKADIRPRDQDVCFGPISDAALGAKGPRRLAIQLCLGVAFAMTVVVLAVVPAIIIAALLYWLTPLDFWPAVGTLLLLTIIAASAVWAYRQKESYRKTIRDFPNPGDVRTHYAEWKGENFDRLLSRYVHYARSANTIDENRKDFQRVAWGGVEPETEAREGPERLIQLWFAGNHSDVGGSYAEVESRLSDNALGWMIGQAITFPNGLKIGPTFVNGVKLPNTPMSGTRMGMTLFHSGLGS